MFHHLNQAVTLNQRAQLQFLGLKQRPYSVLQALQRYKIGDVGVSMIIYGELVFGAYKSLKKIENLAAIEMLMDALEIMPVNEEVIHHYATIRSGPAKKVKSWVPMICGLLHMHYHWTSL